MQARFRLLTHTTLVAAGFLLTGCGPSVSCGDPVAVQTAEEIINGQLRKGGLKKMRVSLEAVRTLSVDRETGRRQCIAQVQITGAGKHRQPLMELLRSRGQDQITYTVEPTEDGNVYVTVYGL